MPSAVAPTAWYGVDVEPLPDVAGESGMAAVTKTWFGYVAVGNTPRGGTSWWSTDGKLWTAAQYAEPSMTNAQLTGVAVIGHRIVAVGGFPEGGVETPRPAIWTSSDGVAWEPDDLGLDGPGGLIRGVATVDGELVAVGDGVMWRSPDGRSWRVTDQDQSFTPTHVVTGPAGTLAWGSVLGTNGWAATSWRLDGVATGTTPNGVTLPVKFSTVVADAGGFVGFAAGDESNQATGRTIYRSSDGITWTQVGSIASAVRDISAAVSVPGFGTVAVVMPDGTGVGQQVLRSSDLASWKPVTWLTPSGPTASVAALTWADGPIVAVGANVSAEESDSRLPAAWVALPAAGDAPIGPEPVASVGCAPLSTLTDPETALRVLVQYPVAPYGTAETSPLPARCFGSRTIHVSGYLGQPEGLGGQCGYSVTPDWLTGTCLVYPAGWLQPIAGPFGASRPLLVFARPAVAALLKGGHWVELTGHYDDPASTTCQTRDEHGKLESIAQTVAMCRSHFVVTAVRPISAPKTPSVNADPAAALGLPDTFVLAPEWVGWDNLALPASTIWGFRRVTPPGGTQILVTVFQCAPADLAALQKALYSVDVVPKTVTVNGISIRMSQDGTQAYFASGSKVFNLSGSAPADAASVQALITAFLATIR
jgi:hypothetical protein